MSNSIIIIIVCVIHVYMRMYKFSNLVRVQEPETSHESRVENQKRSTANKYCNNTMQYAHSTPMINTRTLQYPFF